MSTLSRNSRFLIGFGWAVLTIGSAPALWAAGTISRINTEVTDGGTYVAGVATNTVSLTIFGDGSTAADANQTVTLELLDSSVARTGALSPTTFLTNGSLLNEPTVTFYRAGTTLQLRATPSPNQLANTSGVFTVVAGAAARLVVLGPGMTHAPGTAGAADTGTSGTFTPQEPNQAFTVTVLLTDAYFNQVSGAPVVTFSSTDLITLPSPAALSNGAGTFQVTVTGAQIERTINVSAPSLISGTLIVNTQGPPAQEIFPFPSPFNPKTGQSITFRFRVTQAKNVVVKVMDQFGQDVFERSVNASAGQTDVVWDGRNDRGTIVASGVYYALLEVDGSVKSKKRFGVVK